MRVVNGAVVLLCAVCFCASMAQPALAEDTASNKDAGVTSGTKSPPPKKIPFGLTEELLEPAREAARLAQQKRFDEAETKFKDLLTKVPNYEEGTCNLALIYDQTKRGKEALALLDTLVNKPAQTSRPYLLLSSLYTKDKQQDKALEVLNKATQHLSSDPEVWVRRAQFYSKTNVDKSEADYRKALELDPDNRTALNNLAVILMGQNRYAEALPLLKHYVKVIPKGASGRFNLASVHYSL
ncbi:MAG: tetratricopeptide repeat protein, partial [Myxococcota bacterium]